MLLRSPNRVYTSARVAVHAQQHSRASRDQWLSDFAVLQYPEPHDVLTCVCRPDTKAHMIPNEELTVHVWAVQAWDSKRWFRRLVNNVGTWLRNLGPLLGFLTGILQFWGYGPRVSLSGSYIMLRNQLHSSWVSGVPCRHTPQQSLKLSSDVHEPTKNSGAATVFMSSRLPRNSWNIVALFPCSPIK